MMDVESQRDVEHIRRALNTLRALCGDDDADDADRVMLGLAEQALDALVDALTAATDRPERRHG
jgi:hypothetical protein